MAKYPTVQWTLAMSLLCASTAMASNLLINGNFQGGTYLDNGNYFQSPSNWSQDTGLTLPNGWVDFPPMVDPAISVVPTTKFGLADPIGGGSYVAFQSTANPNGQGQDCLTQDIVTTPGQTYIWSFYVAIAGAAVSNTNLTPEWDADGSNDVEFLDPYYGGGTLATGHTIATNGNEPFKLFQYTVTASESLTRVYFHATDGNPSGAILVADSSIVTQSSVPEPATYCLIGLGLVTFGIWGRKKRADHSKTSARGDNSSRTVLP